MTLPTIRSLSPPTIVSFSKFILLIKSVCLSVCCKTIHLINAWSVVLCTFAATAIRIKELTIIYVTCFLVGFSPGTLPTVPTVPTLPAIRSARSEFSCDFDAGLCGMTQDSLDEIDWIRYRGSTPSQDTGPSRDHTSGKGEYHSNRSLKKVAARFAKPSTSWPTLNAFIQKCLSDSDFDDRGLPADSFVMTHEPFIITCHTIIVCFKYFVRRRKLSERKPYIRV